MLLLGGGRRRGVGAISVLLGSTKGLTTLTGPYRSHRPLPLSRELTGGCFGDLVSLCWAGGSDGHASCN